MTTELAERPLAGVPALANSMRIPPRRIPHLPPIEGVDLAGKSVLLRANVTVAMRPDLVAGRAELGQLARSIDSLTARGASVVVISHFGEPKGEPNPVWSLAPIATVLAAERGRPVGFVPDCIGSRAEAVTRSLAAGDVVLLENLRFHKGEQSNDRSFAMLLSVHGDLYVNDCPSRPRRLQASTHAITELMPAYAGPVRVRAAYRQLRKDS